MTLLFILDSHDGISFWIAVSSFFLGLCTIVISTWRLIVSNRNSKKTIFINSVTSNRIQGIQDTRSNIKELIKISSKIEDSFSELEKNKRNEMLNDFRGVQALLRLRVNNDEEKFYSALKEVAVAVNSNDFGIIQGISFHLSKLIDEGNEMLRRDWNRVVYESRFGDLFERKKKK